MRQHRSRTRLAVTAAAGTVALIAGFTAPAVASPNQSAAPGAGSVVRIADRAAAALGGATGGHYIDKAGHAVVTVLHPSDEAKVRAAGATPKLVRHSLADLRTAKRGFDQLRGVTNAGWGIDPTHNQVVVRTYDNTPAAATKALTDKARSLGDEVRVEHVQGRPRFFIRGGDEISNGNALCSNGFNVTRGGQNYLLSAGHCAVLGGDGPWNGGQVVSADFPNEDSMLVENTDPDSPSEINDGTPITSVADPTVGESMKRSGRTTGITSGTVTDTDYTFTATENGQTYRVPHEFCTNAYSEAGDSGGPAYDGNVGLGTLTGGDSSTSCFYPVTRSMAAYGVSLPSS